jgi:hypothetical protein
MLKTLQRQNVIFSGLVIKRGNAVLPYGVCPYTCRAAAVAFLTLSQRLLLQLM